MAAIGTKSNRSAIGARVKVTVGPRTMIGEIMSGGSFYSQNSLVLHFGLGNADVVNQVQIQWPSGIVQTWKNVGVNQKVIATEDSPELRAIRPRAGAR